MPEVSVVICSVDRVVFTVCITVVAENIAADAKYFLSCRSSGSVESEDRNICFLIKLKEYQKFYGLSIGSQPPRIMVTHYIVFSNHVCIKETKAITEITEAKYRVLIYVLSPQHRNGFR